MMTNDGPKKLQLEVTVLNAAAYHINRCCDDPTCLSCVCVCFEAPREVDG